MFVRVAQDVIDEALKGTEIAIETLHLIATGIQRNKHWYSLPRQTAKKLSGILSDYEKRLFVSVDNNDTNSMSKCIGVELVVSFQKPDAQEGKTILWYNPKIIVTFEIFEETHVLCENLYDIEFYKNCLDFYRYNSGKDAHKKGDSKFLARNGGGATTAAVLKNEILRGEHLVLVISDSDYRFFDTEDKPGPLGDTATAINAVVNDHPKGFHHHYTLKYHREAENLIPFRILDEISGPSRKQKDLLRGMGKDLRVFDFKEGLTYQDLYGPKIYDYWKRVLNGKKDISFRETIRPLGSTQTVEEYKKRLLENKKQSGEASKPIFVGWGSSILDTATTKLKRLKGKDRIKPNDLTPLQYEEWMEIGKLLFNWTLVPENKKRYL